MLNEAKIQEIEGHLNHVFNLLSMACYPKNGEPYTQTHVAAYKAADQVLAAERTLMNERHRQRIEKRQTR